MPKNHVTINDAGHLRFGLGICDHLVQLMGGSMHIESAPQKGCSVVFSARFDHSHLGSRLIDKHMRELNNIKTLIVDDNAIARTVMKTTAKSIGLVVDDVENAEQALEKFSSCECSGSTISFCINGLSYACNGWHRGGSSH